MSCTASRDPPIVKYFACALQPEVATVATIQQQRLGGAEIVFGLLEQTI
jgi:hypothetical protein